MGKVICIRTGKKWRGPKPSQVAAQAFRSGEASRHPRRGENEFRSIGSIAAPIVGRLMTR